MLRSEAARYARWSALAALALAALTATVYFRRDWVRHVEKKNAPPAEPVDVLRQSAGINFKKVDQNRTVFEIEASKSTEFKDQDANLLQDVRITIYGKTGERHDVIHTRSCEYRRENDGISCGGEVQIELITAVDAQRVNAHPEIAKSVTTHIATKGINFDRASGLAQTNQKVTFAFPSGSGEGVGLEYRSEEGTVRLLRDVHFKLIQDAPASRKASTITRGIEQVEVSGTSLDFARDSRMMRLMGPAEARTSAELLRAGAITLSLDSDFHAQTMVASGSGTSRPAISSTANGEQIKLDADTLTAHFSPQGAVAKLDAAGSVHGLRSAKVEEEQASADAATLELWPWLGRPKELNLTGNVLLRTKGGKAETRILRTAAFRVEFSQGDSGHIGKAQRAETLAAGSMEWTDSPQQAGAPAVTTKLLADRLRLDFAEAGKARRLAANGNVQTERSAPGQQAQTASAHNGVVELQATGGWSEMNLDGDVKLKQGERSGAGAHALFARGSQTATLTGNALVRDASTETRAPKITFVQDSGEIRAEGGVRSADFSARGSAVQLARAPVNISADRLEANSKSGRAFYSGHAHLWQGDSVLEAESIELLRESRVLHASGNVRGVFPQTASTRPAAPTLSRATQQPSGPALTPTALATSPNTKAHLWHVSAEALTYSDKESRAHLERNVTVQSTEQKMHAPVLDLYFTRSGRPADTGGGNSPEGSQQISRAVGTGGVVVEEGDRKATAEHGEYIAADGKFVMSGGNPTIYDGSAGTTTGRQLTFFLADDTIIVDSENGSRTLTKHRVQK